MEVEAERAGEAPDAGRQHARKRAEPKRWSDDRLATANLGGSSAKRARVLVAARNQRLHNLPCRMRDP